MSQTMGHADGDESDDDEINGVSDPKLVAELMERYDSRELRRVAREAGAVRKRGDSKKQTAWRIVKQNRAVAIEAVGRGGE